MQVARYLVGEVGLRQLLYIGTRLPTGVKIHEVAQETLPGCRVVYVIDDDVTLAHAHRLASSAPDAVSAYIRGSLSDPQKLLRQAGETLDLAQPVGITVQGSLHQIPDDDDACRIVERLLAAVPSGSYLAISHLTSDLLGEQMAKSLERLEQMVEASKMQALTIRSRAQIARLFDGLDMVDPGIVPVDQWRPDEAAPDVVSDLGTLMYAAVGRKP